jgi:hypothetical protein
LPLVAGVSVLAKALAAVLLEAARKTFPATALVEAIVEARRDPVTAAVRSVPVSAHDDIGSIVWNAIAVHPYVAGSAWRDAVPVRRRLLIDTCAVPSDAHAD